MSRVGRKPIPVPSGVAVTIEGHSIRVQGGKGKLVFAYHPEIGIRQEDGMLWVECTGERRQLRAMHGTTRSLVANMVQGVSVGFTRTLDLVGVGYRASKKGTKLQLNVGYSHPVDIEPEPGIEFEVPSNTQVVVKGIDKNRVGEMAALIRSVRRPEPYKGKGIRYVDEYVRRKEGKTGKK
ncbi:50S ribosomal protein L6 [Pasteuria penetrans]|uniref:50S ribosomal protein L6 n=1 Tax=Pasteuria penetrans TaxID=86005 RepID=UPI000FB7C20A|nr:50S ribosomal protein L6 [Pasteuria penetrans]